MASPPGRQADIFQTAQQIRDAQQRIRELADEYDNASVRRKYQIQQETESLRIQIFVNRDFIANLREQIRLTSELARAEEKAANERRRQAQQNLQAAQQTANTFKQLFAIASSSGPQGLLGYAVGRGVSGLMNQAAGVPQAQAAAGGGSSGGGGGASGVATALAGVAIGAAALVTGLQQAERAAMSFAQFASPAQVARAQRAQEDLAAAIGVILLPIVDTTARVFDRMNRLVTELQPVLEPLVEELAAFFETLITQGIEQTTMALREFQPEIRSLIQLFGELAKATLEVTGGMLSSYAFLLELQHRIRAGNLAGAMDFADVARAAAERGRAGGALTIAARPATYIGTEEIGRQARLAAFGARDISQQQLQAQQETNNLLGDILVAVRPQDANPLQPSLVFPTLNWLTAPFRWSAAAGEGLTNTIFNW